MPNIVAIKCPSCAGEIELDRDREFGFCVFCGTRIFIPNAVQRIKGTVSIDNSPILSSHLVLADRAISVGNFTEAASHYEQCLVIDPDNAAANLGKGICSLATANVNYHDFRHLGTYGANAFSRLIDDNGYRAIVSTLASLDNAMRSAFTETSTSQYRPGNAARPNNAAFNAISQEKKLISSMLDEACSAVGQVIRRISLENAIAPIVTDAWETFSYNMTQIEKDLRSTEIPNAKVTISRLLQLLPTVAVLRAEWNKKLADEYWSQNKDEYSYLQQKKQRISFELSKCGLFDLSTKAKLKKRLTAIENRLMHPTDN